MTGPSALIGGEPAAEETGNATANTSVHINAARDPTRLRHTGANDHSKPDIRIPAPFLEDYSLAANEPRDRGLIGACDCKHERMRCDEPMWPAEGPLWPLPAERFLAPVSWRPRSKQRLSSGTTRCRDYALRAPRTPPVREPRRLADCWNVDQNYVLRITVRDRVACDSVRLNLRPFSRVYDSVIQAVIRVISRSRCRRLDRLRSERP